MLLNTVIYSVKYKNNFDIQCHFDAAPICFCDLKKREYNLTKLPEAFKCTQ